MDVLLHPDLFLCFYCLYLFEYLLLLPDFLPRDSVHRHTRMGQHATDALHITLNVVFGIPTDALTNGK